MGERLLKKAIINLDDNVKTSGLPRLLLTAAFQGADDIG